MLDSINRFQGPAMMEPATYVQCGSMLIGEGIGDREQAGVFDHNVVPFTPFCGTGRASAVRAAPPLG